MLSRKTKTLFYLSAGPVLKVNGILYRLFRVPKTKLLKVHLGPGQKNYINGWVNIDANMFTAKCDLWADLRNPLPFPTESIDAVYSHHMIEHLPNIEFHLKDVFRRLKPGGVILVGGPNGDSAIKKFIEDDKAWFGDFPDKRSSIGGRLENFIFCRQEHLTILTFSFLQELMMNIGFKDIRLCLPVKETNFPDLFSDVLDKEFESDFDMPHTLIIEATKPSSISI
jgi:predicted SAM-dependent methyltransferase